MGGYGTFAETYGHRGHASFTGPDAQMPHILHFFCLIIYNRYATQPREVVLDCGPYQDNSGLSERLLNELDDALHFLSDYNLSAHREDRDPTYISKQVLFLILNTCVLSLFPLAKKAEWDLQTGAESGSLSCLSTRDQEQGNVGGDRNSAGH